MLPTEKSLRRGRKNKALTIAQIAQESTPEFLALEEALRTYDPSALSTQVKSRNRDRLYTAYWAKRNRPPYEDPAAQIREFMHWYVSQYSEGRIKGTTIKATTLLQLKEGLINDMRSYAKKNRIPLKDLVDEWFYSSLTECAYLYVQEFHLDKEKSRPILLGVNEVKIMVAWVLKSPYMRSPQGLQIVLTILILFVTGGRPGCLTPLRVYKSDEVKRSDGQAHAPVWNDLEVIDIEFLHDNH